MVANIQRGIARRCVDAIIFFIMNPEQSAGRISVPGQSCTQSKFITNTASIIGPSWNVWVGLNIIQNRVLRQVSTSQSDMQCLREACSVSAFDIDTIEIAVRGVDIAALVRSAVGRTIS